MNWTMTLLKWIIGTKINQSNPDPNKQAEEVIFSQKSKKINRPPLFFNNIQVSQSLYQKHFGIILDEHFTFCKDLKILASKINKTMWLLRKLQSILPGQALKVH